MPEPAKEETGSPQPSATPAQFVVRRMRADDILAVADYHRVGIPTGVLAELGTGVLAKVYGSLLEGSAGFVFVGTDERGRVAGFVSGVVDVGRLYRRVLWRHFPSFALAGLRYLGSLRMLRRILNTLRYPSKVSGAYPQAELLSIVVAPDARGTGLAGALLVALRREFAARGIEQFKVMVRADFARANAYYQKHGFTLAGQITTHGHPANIYVSRSAEP